MPELRICLLGGLTLAWGQDSLPVIPGAAARSLFAYLVTHRDRPHTRDLLAGTFWPDLPDDIARHRLSQAVWQIRKALSPHPVLVAEGSTVQINPSLPLWLDVRELEASSESEVGVSAVDLERAAALYGGEFMAGYYDEWLFAERERLRDVYLGVLEQLAAIYKRHGEYENALASARRLAAEDPWREEAHREVMRLCHLLGRDAEALRQYDICRQALADDLAAEPSPETSALAAEITARSDLPVPPLLPVRVRPAAAPSLERPDLLPLVGRQQELAELLRRVEAAAKGRGGLTILYGEAGVGKSRLLRELADNAHWRGVRSLWGRCYELAAPPAYQPLVEALRAGLPALTGPALPLLWRAELSRLLPDLATANGSPPSLSTEEEKRRLLEAIARGFLALAEAGFHLLLLEDVHWIDLASLEALHYLLPRLEAAPLLVVMSARPEDLAPSVAAALSALEDTQLPRRMTLGRLELAETEELVRRALDLERPAPHFSARLHAETEGNPFFLVETLRTLIDEGLLYCDEGGAWSTPWDESTQDYAELPLPPGVAQSIERRLARLPAQVAELLNLAATIGRWLEFRLWLAASGRQEEELLAAGDDLCARGLLLAADPASGRATAGADYAFTHDLIRRVAYGRLAGPHRRFYHRRVAEALTRWPAEIEVLAYHWTQAEEWDKATDCHRQAGDLARAVYAHAQAADHYGQALAAVEQLPGAADALLQFQLHLAREAEYGLIAQREAQAKDLEALAALAQTLQDGALQARVALRQSDYYQAVGSYAESLAAAQEAVRLAQAIPDIPLQAEAQRQWGYVLWHQGDFRQALDRLEAALALARRCGRHPVEAESLRDLGTICGQQGDYDQALSCYQQALPILRQIGDRRGEGMILNNLGLVSRCVGNYAAARSYHEQSLQIRREIGDQRGESHVLNSLGVICRHQRDYGQARLYFEQTLALQQEAGDRWVQCRTLNNLAMTYLNLGDYASAEVCFEQALKIHREIGDRPSEAAGLEGLGLICHYRGDHQAAHGHLLQALALSRDLGDRDSQAYMLTSLGHVLAALGRQTEAADSYRQSLALRREMGQHNLAIESLAGLARVAQAQGDVAEARAYVAEILGYLDSGGTMDGTEEPIRVYLTCYQVLQASHDPRADATLKTAHHLLQDVAARIEDEVLRRFYLDNVPAHRELVASYRQWYAAQTITLLLPRAGTPLGHPLSDDEWVTVTWTVAAAEDQLIADKAARRHQRLLRLLREAQAHGAAPTHQHLADALGVSRRTVERDVAALRSQNPDLASLAE